MLIRLVFIACGVETDCTFQKVWTFQVNFWWWVRQADVPAAADVKSRSKSKKLSCIIVKDFCKACYTFSYS